MSPKAKAAAANLKLLHPGWEHLYFDDGDIRRFVSAEFPQYQAVFDGFPRTIQRIDFFRYLAVFRFGGFYFDLDVFLSESLSRLLDCGCVFPFEELTANRFLRLVAHQKGTPMEVCSRGALIAPPAATPKRVKVHALDIPV